MPFDYEAVVQACARGDRLALRQLYDQESGWLLGVVMRIVRDRQLAEHVLQESFLRIWQQASGFNAAQGSARGWIYTLVRHRALEEARKPGHIRRAEVGAVSSLVWQTVQAVEHRELPDLEKLERCMALLEPERRACIEVAFIEGYSLTELATRLGKPEGTVSSWTRQSLLSLRECLQ